MTPALIDKAKLMYDARQFTMTEIATSCGVTPAPTPMTIYRNINTTPHTAPPTPSTTTNKDHR